MLNVVKDKKVWVLRAVRHGRTKIYYYTNKP